MRIAIVGSREFSDAAFVERCVERLAKKHGDDLVIVSRGLRGVGKLVEAAVPKFCKQPLEVRPSPWSEGKTWSEIEDGKKSNRLFVKSVDQLVVLWDAKADMRGRDVLHAVKCGLEFRKPVFLYDVQEKVWLTERADQWKRTEVEHPLLSAWFRASNPRRYGLTR